MTQKGQALLASVETEQNNPHHDKTVLEHQEAVVQMLPSFASEELKEAAKFHDIGKKASKKVNEKTGYDQFVGHADISADLYLENAADLSNGNVSNEYVAELIRLHDTKYSKQSKIETMLANHPDKFAGELIALQTADVLGQSPYKRLEKLEQIKDYSLKLYNLASPEQQIFLEGAIEFVHTEIEVEKDAQELFHNDLEAAIEDLQNDIKYVEEIGFDLAD